MNNNITGNILTWGVLEPLLYHFFPMMCCKISELLGNVPRSIINMFARALESTEIRLTVSELSGTFPFTFLFTNSLTKLRSRNGSESSQVLQPQKMERNTWIKSNKFISSSQNKYVQHIPTSPNAQQQSSAIFDALLCDVLVMFRMVGNV